MPEYVNVPVRQFIIEPYRFFYFIDERNKTIRIIDVWYGAQSPLASGWAMPEEVSLLQRLEARWAAAQMQRDRPPGWR